MAKMLVRKVRSSCAALISSSRSCGCCSAALLTSTSSRPSSATVRATASRQKASSPTSPAIAMARRPCSSISALVVCASRCSSRYQIATSAPSLAKPIATARPMPLSPPVTRATLPSSLPAARYARISAWGRGCIWSWRPGCRSCSCGGMFRPFASDMVHLLCLRSPRDRGGRSLHAERPRRREVSPRRQHPLSVRYLQLDDTHRLFMCLQQRDDERMLGTAYRYLLVVIVLGVGFGLIADPALWRSGQHGSPGARETAGAARSSYEDERWEDSGGEAQQGEDH